jgi:hypothetical protein
MLPLIPTRTPHPRQLPACFLAIATNRSITVNTAPRTNKMQHHQADQGSCRANTKPSITKPQHLQEDHSETDATTVDTQEDGSFSSLSIASKKSCVSFGDVRVRTHSVTLGDNPAVTTGLPLALDWDHVDSNSYNLEDFEKRKRRTRVMRIPVEEREARLREMGHSKDSLDEISQEIEKIKTSRRESSKLLSPMDEYLLMANVSLRDKRLVSRETRKLTSEKEAAKKSSRGKFPFLLVRRNNKF